MLHGLSSSEAQERLKIYGWNTIPEDKPRSLVLFLKKFWGPVPWMLEISLIFELVMGRYTQAVIICLLLVFNAIVAFSQESRAQNTLALLQQKLAVQAKVLRDQTWQTLPARNLVPGDIIHLRMGDLIPADVRLDEGQIATDQSALTGESLPVELSVHDTGYAGSIVQRGEATAEVTATGTHTFYGKTAELVHSSRTQSHLEETIFVIVKYLVALDVLLIIGVLIYSWVNALPWSETIPFALILLIASVPIAMPATFTLAAALGAQELTKFGVLVTRLSAIEEAAAMDVLCSDKTGTITKNQLVLKVICPFAPYTEADTLRYASLASDDATQDPLDMAIVQAQHERYPAEDDFKKIAFIPFDPQTKRTEASVQLGDRKMQIVKGAPQRVVSLGNSQPEFDHEVENLAKQGMRVLAVAVSDAKNGSSGNQLVGLLGFYDPPRPDSKALIQALQDLAVRVVMITGDGLATARAIASQVNLGKVTCAADAMHAHSNQTMLDCDVIAEVLPEDKHQLVMQLQSTGHVVGMTGDGVNDAPALKQAEVGIAVSNATDVARTAASIILTSPGLSNVVSAVKIGRQIYQRLLTYTLNKIIKTFQIALFLALGLFITGIFVTTPRLVILLLFANDFVTMSLSSDRVKYSPRPERWPLRPIIFSAFLIAIAWLVFSFGTLMAGLKIYPNQIPELQTLVFVMLVFTGQANVYLVRERGHFWDSRPGKALLLSTLGDLIVVTVLATQGILMSAVGFTVIGVLFLAVVIYMFMLDWLKSYIFRWMKLVR
jgi:H+-transporting ATPase